MENTSVKIMQCGLSKAGQLKINCIGVGVGIIIHSRTSKIGAGIHVLAPYSTTPTPENPAKFASTAIPYAIELLKKEGGSPPLSVAIAGGASMEGSTVGSRMGEKVVAAVKEAVKKANLNIVADETGGSKIRTMQLDVRTGQIQIT